MIRAHTYRCELLLVPFSQEVSHEDYLTLTAQSFSNTDSKVTVTYSIAQFQHILCDHANSHVSLLLGCIPKKIAMEACSSVQTCKWADDEYSRIHNKTNRWPAGSHSVSMCMTPDLVRAR